MLIYHQNTSLSHSHTHPPQIFPNIQIRQRSSQTFLSQNSGLLPQRESNSHIKPAHSVFMVLLNPFAYRRWERRVVCRWCPWWWGRGLWGRSCPTSAGLLPETEASWSPRPAAPPAWPPSEPPLPWAGWGQAAGLEGPRSKSETLINQVKFSQCFYLWWPELNATVEVNVWDHS